MKGTARLFEAILFAALIIFSGGCYTVLSTVAYRGGSGGIPDQSSSDRISPTEQATAEPDSFAEPSETPEFGLKPKTYYQDTDREYTETEQDNDKTVVNNYYYYPEPYYDSWWNRPFYSRAWNYDPWFWDGPFWPYRYYGLYIGFGYNSYPWYNPWIYGYDGYWVDPWCWYDPWYDYSWWHYPYSGWYAGGYDHYPWGWGHGGGGGGNDVTNGPRKYRTDRLSGFGTSRDAGGVVTVGNGSNETLTSKPVVSGRTARGDARDGFGTSNTRRQSPASDKSSATDKPAGGSTSTNTGAPARRNTGQTTTPVHQRVQSGEMIRRYTSPEPVGVEVSPDALSRPVIQQGDEQIRMKESTYAVVRREATPDISDENAASGRSKDDSSKRARVLPGTWTILRRSENTPTVRSDQVQESPSTEKPTVSPATKEQASSERSPSYTSPSKQTEQPKSSGTRESVSARPSNSTPSGNSRPSSGSGGSISRPSSGSGGSVSRPSSGSGGGGSRSSGSSGGGRSGSGGSRSGSGRR